MSEKHEYKDMVIKNVPYYGEPRWFILNKDGTKDKRFSGYTQSTLKGTKKFIDVILTNENHNIKNKAWNDISKFNDLNDGKFIDSVISFKINNNYNLVVWCTISKAMEGEYRCYIVTLRYNPYNCSFDGKDIHTTITNNITKEELDKAIDYVLACKELKEFI